MRRSVWRNRSTAVGLAVTVLGGLAMINAPQAEGPKAPKPNTPDQRVGLLGEFLWARARDTFEDVRFCEDPSELRFTFKTGDAFKRSNLTSLRPGLAYTVQPTHFRLDTTGSHNAKLMLGYMSTKWRFTHDDNSDLAHWAGRDRVLLFIPVRHAGGVDPTKQENYFLSPYAAQTICVMELKAGELVRYEWFRGGPEALDEHILFDLYPYCGGAKGLKPGVSRPIFKFEVFPGGRWKVSIERDGRDGLAGGDVDGDFDLLLTEKSPGAKPYGVDLSGETAFGLSVYCPSGHPNLGADIRLRLEPFDRATGGALKPLGRRIKIRDIKLGDLPEALGEQGPAGSGRGAGARGQSSVTGRPRNPRP